MGGVTPIELHLRVPARGPVAAATSDRMARKGGFLLLYDRPRVRHARIISAIAFVFEPKNW